MELEAYYLYISLQKQLTTKHLHIIKLLIVCLEPMVVYHKSLSAIEHDLISIYWKIEEFEAAFFEILNIKDFNELILLDIIKLISHNL